MIAMKFTIELDIGLSFLQQAALPQLLTDRETKMTAATGNCPETAIWLPGGGHESCPLTVMGSARHEIRLSCRFPRCGLLLGCGCGAEAPPPPGGTP